MIFFSIIIPTYNRAHLIAETIDSVLAQTHEKFEILIVDDGSKDDTRKMIEKEYGVNSKVNYFYKQNEERGKARNFGLKEAKGDYAIFFDSDDLMKPDYLQTLDEVIRENKGVKLLAAKYNYDNNGKIETNPFLKDLAEGWYSRDLFLKGNILACNFCIKIKENEFKYFPSERELASMEDWLFLLSNLSENKMYIKDKICVTMRQHDERSMSDNQKVITARWKAMNWISENLDLNEQEKKKLSAWSHHFCGVHEYLDHKRIAPIKEAITAIKEN